ncbi:MAG TPA: hypothetical protein VK054_11355 [Beutenbergiaceae bacterium]|nr:hypothetical protein [Beutenbergiaceae bacterium]
MNWPNPNQNDDTLDVDLDLDTDTGSGNDPGTEGVDLPVMTDDQDEALEEDSTPTEAQAAPTRRRGVDRGLIRRVAAKVVEVQEADPTDVEVLAGLLGGANDPVTVTVGIMTASRADLGPLGDVENFAAMEDMEKAVSVMSMDGRKRGELWKTLAALGVVTGNIPRSDAKAALTLGAVKVTDEALEQISRVRDLAKKV